MENTINESTDTLTTFRQFMAGFSAAAEIVATRRLFPELAVDPETGILDLGIGVWCEPFAYTHAEPSIGGTRRSERIGWRAVAEEIIYGFDRWEPPTTDDVTVAEVFGPLSDCALEVSLALHRRALLDDLQAACSTIDCRACHGTGYRNPLRTELGACNECKGTGLRPEIDAALEPFRI